MVMYIPLFQQYNTVAPSRIHIRLVYQNCSGTAKYRTVKYH